MNVLIRERMVELEEAALKLKIHEVGGDNHGPWVKIFLAEVGLPEGYAWCDGDQSYYEHQAAEKRLPIESASVLQTWQIATRLGWVALNPARADLVCYRWTGSGPPFGDHIGLVVAASSLGAFWKLQTIEGNTSSGVAGSQGNGDGMYARTRIISKSSCGFVRIPGYVDLAPVAKVTHKPGVVIPRLPGRNLGPAPELVSENGLEKATIAKPTLLKSGTTAGASKPSAKKATAKKKTAAKKTSAKKTSAKKTSSKKSGSAKRTPKK